MKTLACERDRIELVHRLKQVHPGCTRRWGRMTAHQMVCHLSDAFRMAMSRKPVSRATGPLQRTVQKWIALYLPLPWPPGILTRPEIDQELSGTAPVDFAADVAELEALMTLFVTSPRTFDRPEHPIFGRMSDAAWLRWGYRHMDHHLRQFGL